MATDIRYGLGWRVVDRWPSPSDYYARFPASQREVIRTLAQLGGWENWQELLRLVQPVIEIAVTDYESGPSWPRAIILFSHSSDYGESRWGFYWDGENITYAQESRIRELLALDDAETALDEPEGE